MHERIGAGRCRTSTSVLRVAVGWDGVWACGATYARVLWECARLGTVHESGSAGMRAKGQGARVLVCCGCGLAARLGARNGTACRRVS